MSVAKIKQHDTKGVFIDILKVDGIPVDLTNTEVKFLLKKPGLSISGDAAVVTPLSGSVRYQPVATDVAVCGKYQQEWEVKFLADNRFLTFPNDSWNIVIIEPDLGGNAP